MIEYALDQAVIEVPDAVRTNVVIPISGHDFQAHTPVKITITNRFGAQSAEILSDARGSFSTVENGLPAYTSLNSTGVQVSEDDEVTIDDVTYVFKAAPEDAYEVLIGDYAFDSLLNLRAAINLMNYEYEVYGLATLEHPSVEATSLTVEALGLVAKNNGVEGNDIPVSTTSDELSFPDSTLSGGAQATNLTFLGYSTPVDGLVTIIATDGANEVEAKIHAWLGT